MFTGGILTIGRAAKRLQSREASEREAGPAQGVACTTTKFPLRIRRVENCIERTNVAFVEIVSGRTRGHFEGVVENARVRARARARAAPTDGNVQVLGWRSRCSR